MIDHRFKAYAEETAGHQKYAEQKSGGKAEEPKKNASPSPYAGNVLRFQLIADNSKGKMQCALYENKQTWLGHTFRYGAESVIKNRVAWCVFKNVKPGIYAMSSYHDEDNDLDVDTNFLGIPTEGYACSRDATGGITGAPSWKDARFRYTGGNKAYRLNVHYVF